MSQSHRDTYAPQISCLENYESQKALVKSYKIASDSFYILRYLDVSDTKKILMERDRIDDIRVGYQRSNREGFRLKIKQRE